MDIDQSKAMMSEGGFLRSTDEIKAYQVRTYGTCINTNCFMRVEEQKKKVPYRTWNRYRTEKQYSTVRSLV